MSKFSLTFSLMLRSDNYQLKSHFTGACHCLLRIGGTKVLFMYLLLLNTEGEPWRNPSRGCNCIWGEVSGVFRASVKLTVQGQDYPDHWIRVLLPGTVTSHCVPVVSLFNTTNPQYSVMIITRSSLELTLTL